MTLRILLADDQELVRTGLRTLCERDGDISVVAEAADGRQAITLARQERPDVILMDIRMPTLDGISATKTILTDPRIDPPPRILVLTTYEQDEYVFQALRAGASGFLTKDVDPSDLRAAIRTVADGDSLLSPRATRALVEAFTTNPPHQPDHRLLGELTEREREVLALVGRGLTNTDIGRKLFLSPATVKTHVNRAMSKLAVRARAQLVVIAYETGLIRPGDGADPPE